jgi:anaerobic selenocysteine-containing dehydrogenase
MCVSCAWAKPAKTRPLEFRENGAKATACETTNQRADRSFFEAHTLTELEDWRDHDLEEQGRLTHPMRLEHACCRPAGLNLPNGEARARPPPNFNRSG